MIKHDDNGFTLVELIVAIIILAFLGVSTVIITVLMSNNFGKQNLNSQVMIETQALSSSLQDSLKSCSYVNSGPDFIEVNLVKGSTDCWYYYILNNNVVYLKAFPDKQDVTTITYDDSDFLARFIQSMAVTPIEFDVTADELTDYNITYTIVSNDAGSEYVINNLVQVRNGH